MTHEEITNRCKKASRIGAGTFSRVYREGSGRVINLSVCPSRKTMATRFPKSVFLPDIKPLGPDAYEMSYYRVFENWDTLEAALAPSSLKFSKELYDLVYKAGVVYSRLEPWERDVRTYISSKQKQKMLIKCGAALLKDHGEFQVEFPPRNLGVDDRGRLILLDIFYVNFDRMANDLTYIV